jgi:hypothetical protein
MLDSGTISGSIILFIVTTIVITFILSQINPPYLQQKDIKKINKWKAVGGSTIISFIFTLLITIISIKVDKANLKTAKNI